jgi:hypothetical protein
VSLVCGPARESNADVAVSMLESIADERLRYPSSESISARVGSELSFTGFPLIVLVDIRELKLLSEFSHPNIVKFVSHAL